MSVPIPGLAPTIERQKATIYLTASDLANDPGPLTTVRYAVVLSLGPEVFRWVYGDTSTIDGVTVIGTNGTGSIGRWLRSRSTLRGTDLTDANATLTVSGNQIRVITPSTLTSNRVLTLGVTGASAGDSIQISRNDVGAFTVTIVNGGDAGGNIAVMPVSARAWAIALFDGDDWIHIASSLSLATA